MVREMGDERRKLSEQKPVDTRGALWSLPGGERLPNMVEAAPVGMGDPAHPARLRPSDLEEPQHFHARLAAWLLRQG